MREGDDALLELEKLALSFNPFGDALDSSGSSKLQHETALARDRASSSTTSNAVMVGHDDNEDEDAVTHRLASLKIPSNGIDTGKSISSNASSAVSAKTVPLFDAQPGNYEQGYDAGTFGTQTANLTTDHSPFSFASNAASPKHASQGVSVSVGANLGGAPRRHRLSSASSVKSTRSRRSTSSSLSSLGIRVDPQVEGNGGLPDGGIVVPSSIINDIAASTIPSRPLMEQSNSQDSMISLQPSVMSFEAPIHATPPVAGYRIPASGTLQQSTFPQLDLCGPAFRDLDQHPIYVCSAILGTAIHPAKAGPHLVPPVRMSFAGKEILHEGRFDLLPITSDMRWCEAKDGQIPYGKEPIQGGYEESGEQLYHALAKIRDFWVPGKTGTHLEGANFPFAGREVRLTSGYKILCWTSRQVRMDVEASEKHAAGEAEIMQDRPGTAKAR